MGLQSYLACESLPRCRSRGTTVNMPTNEHTSCKMSKDFALVRAASALLVASAALFASSEAHALVNVGAEAGLVKRTADSPNNLKLGVGYGVHAELDLLPLLKIGPYLLHYELSGADDLVGSPDAAFTALGLRARLMLPVPGSIKPYAYVGAGYTWVTYTYPVIDDRAGRFVEIPIGVGAAFEPLPLLQISLDVAYRPATSFGGVAYSTPSITHPGTGYSALLGVAVNL
jgi:opacity protein-like surface antigen